MALNYKSSVWDPKTLGVSAEYNSTATTYSNGATPGFQTDNQGNLKVTLATQIAGEDINNDVHKVEQRFSYSTFTSATTVAVKSASGFLHTINIGAVSCPSIIVYDNTTPNGTVIHRFPPNSPIATYTFNVSFNTGLSLDAIAGGGGVAPFLSLSYR